MIRDTPLHTPFFFSIPSWFGVFSTLLFTLFHTALGRQNREKVVKKKGRQMIRDTSHDAGSIDD